MTDYQFESEYFQIPNVLADAFSKLQLGGYEWRTLWAIIRKTFGWKKLEDRISITQLEGMTGLSRRHQHRALMALIDKNIVTKNGNKKIFYSVQMDFDRWKTITKNGNTILPKKAMVLLPKTVNTKHNNKNNIQKPRENLVSQAVCKDDFFVSSSEIYEKYAKDIRSGGKKKAVEIINELLLSGLSKGYLMKAIDAHKEKYIRDNTEEKYYCQANRFFGEDATYKKYDSKQVFKYKDPDPYCKICNGTGNVAANEDHTEAKPCKCRHLEPVP